MAAKQNAVPQLIETTPGPPLNFQFQLLFGTTGKRYQGPNFQITPGMVVTLYPVNGSAVNADSCSIADRPELLGTVSARNVPPGADVSVGWPCQNLNQIWAQGTAGDGLLFVVQQAAVG